MTIDQHGSSLEPAVAGTRCAIPIVGDPAKVDSSGTHLAATLRAAAWEELSGRRDAFQIFPVGWKLGRESSTAVGWLRHVALRCSATLDELERPATLEYFTPSLSEWVSDFVLDAPPIFVAHHASAIADTPRTENIGLETVTWLRDFLATSQERACAYAHVPVATFYMWRKKPHSVVRPASVADGLRLRSSLELAVTRRGKSEVVRAISSGHPSILDQLADPDTWSAAVRVIADLAQPEAAGRAKRMRSPEDYIERLRRLDEKDTGDDRLILGAEQMTPEQIADAEAWGWGSADK